MAVSQIAFTNLPLLPRSRRCLIGVSGGRDSVALLHWLVANGHRKLIVCHLDHGLRGRASAADARFVEKLAASFALPFFGKKIAVSERASAEKCSLETAARAARYEFFAEVARETKCRRVILAHHADDQVETFLFNLFRGAGSAGLGAMRLETTRKIGRISLMILRPWLGVWRSEIDEYVANHDLAFREDASNADSQHTRNRFRHDILPALEQQFGREIRRNLWRASEILAAENDWLRALTPAVSDALAVSELREMPLAQQRRVIRDWLAHHKIADCGFREIESVRALIELGSPLAKINLPRARHARRRAGELFIE